jgi:RNA polymerase sigma-32 factor
MAHARFDEEDGFRAYLNQLSNYEPLDRQTELKLARRWVRRRDQRAAQALVCANLRFVVKIANGYRNYGLRLADLVEEGNIGLLEAVRRFDPERGHRFMTYAAYWIRAYVLAHVLKQRSLVGVGTGPLQSKMFFGLSRERARLASQGHDAAEVERQLAETFGTTTERVRQMSGRLEGRDLSLDTLLFPSGGATGLDMLVDDAAEPEQAAADAERSELVRRRVMAAMRHLSPRERYIVEHRLLADGEGQTLAEIGRHLGLSRERVRQLEERLKLKLQRELVDLVDDAERPLRHLPEPVARRPREREREREQQLPAAA